MSKKTGSSPEVVITENLYDELGQLSKKPIGRKRDGTNQNTYTTNPIDSLRYSYNIRGWLRGINKDYARNENSAQNWFGMELAYDFGFNAKQFNGNIAGMRWRSKGDGEERAYGFGYDNVNRLLRAEFTQNNGGWNTTAKVDYTMKMGNGTSPYTAYDANGNILGMIQRGLKLNASPTIDSLRYGYDANSNKLNYVTDIANDVNTRLGDFKEINNNTSQDYTYDGNGNMIVDNNKAISSITYNHLNLPNVITITGKGTITYTYDAAGNKLMKETVDNTVVPSKTTTTLYSGTNIYQNDIIQFILHEEGRVRPIRPGYTDTMYYDYFEKDHLGNVRVVLTDEIKQDIYPAATLEGVYSDGNTAVGYEKNFYTIDQSKIVDKSTATGITDYENNNGIASPYPTGNSGNTNYSSNSQKLYKLQATAVTNGGVNGLGMTLKVMSGDKIDILGKSYYFTSNTGGNNYNVPVADIIAGLLGATGGTAGLKGFTSTDLNGQSAITTPISNFLSDADRGTGTVPKAYINWILFDENFKYVSGNFSRVGTQNVVKDHYGDAAMQNILVNKNGYLYVYVSNQSPVAVFFDNLQVVHTRGPLVEETHYYPFGLTMAGISAKAFKANYAENKYKYNGKEEQRKEFNDGSGLEMYDYGARMYDAQVGVWHAIDPKSEAYTRWSPYNYVLNNPLKYIDPNGQNVYVLIWTASEGNPGHAGIAVDNYKKEKYTTGETYKDEHGYSRIRSVEKERMVKDGTVTYHDLRPGNESGVNEKNFDESVKPYYSKIDNLFVEALTSYDFTNKEGRPADGVVELCTSFEQDEYIKNEILPGFKEKNDFYNGLKNNCSDFVREGMIFAAPKGTPLMNSQEKIGSYQASTPHQLFKAAKNLPDAKVLKDPGTSVEKTFIEAVTGGGIKKTYVEMIKIQ